MGLYLDENRVGSILVKVDAGELSELDYAALGYILGRVAGTRIPVIDGVPAGVTNDDLKNMGAGEQRADSVVAWG